MNLQAQIKHDIETYEPMACYKLLESLNLVSFTNIAESNSDDEHGYSVKDGVATINVHGMLVPKTNKDYSHWGLTAYNNLVKYINRADKDPSVTRAVLDISSNGGYVKGLDDVTEAITNFSKPIESHASGNMYSAALNIGVTADTVTATKDSGIGSIGTLLVHYEHSEALKQHGIKATYIRSGKHKAAINSEEPLREDQLEKLRKLVDDDAQEFYEHVAKHRKLSVKTVASWQGDTFNAQTAKDYGLIDKIVKQATSLSTNPTLSREESMDLQQALAKIASLESDNTQKDAALEAEKARADKAETALKQAQEQARQTQLNELTDLGIEMSDDDKAIYLSMSDDAFNVVAKQLKAVQAKEPKLPEHLFSEQATQGAEPHNADDLDANINKWAGA